MSLECQYGRTTPQVIPMMSESKPRYYICEKQATTGHMGKWGHNWDCIKMSRPSWTHLSSKEPELTVGGRLPIRSI